MPSKNDKIYINNNIEDIKEKNNVINYRYMTNNIFDDAFSGNFNDISEIRTNGTNFFDYSTIRDFLLNKKNTVYFNPNYSINNTMMEYDANKTYKTFLGNSNNIPKNLEEKSYSINYPEPLKEDEENKIRKNDNLCQIRSNIKPKNDEMMIQQKNNVKIDEKIIKQDDQFNNYLKKRGSILSNWVESRVEFEDQEKEKNECNDLILDDKNIQNENIQNENIQNENIQKEPTEKIEYFKTLNNMKRSMKKPSENKINNDKVIEENEKAREEMNIPIENILENQQVIQKNKDMEIENENKKNNAKNAVAKPTNELTTIFSLLKICDKRKNNKENDNSKNSSSESTELIEKMKNEIERILVKKDIDININKNDYCNLLTRSDNKINNKNKNEQIKLENNNKKRTQEKMNKLSGKNILKNRQVIQKTKDENMKTKNKIKKNNIKNAPKTKNAKTIKRIRNEVEKNIIKEGKIIHINKNNYPTISTKSDNKLNNKNKNKQIKLEDKNKKQTREKMNKLSGKNILKNRQIIQKTKDENMKTKNKIKKNNAKNANENQIFGKIKEIKKKGVNDININDINIKDINNKDIVRKNYIVPMEFKNKNNNNEKNIEKREQTIKRLFEKSKKEEKLKKTKNITRKEQIQLENEKKKQRQEIINTFLREKFLKNQQVIQKTKDKNMENKNKNKKNNEIPNTKDTQRKQIMKEINEIKKELDVLKDIRDISKKKIQLDLSKIKKNKNKINQPKTTVKDDLKKNNFLKK